MRRAIYLAGRFGTNILVVGLAFFLVYLIPTATFGGIGGVQPRISAGKFDTATNDFLSPTRGARYEAQGNTSFRFLALVVDRVQIYNWTNAWARDHGGQPFGPPGYYAGYDNYTALQAYLAQFPSQIVIDTNSAAGQLVRGDYTPSSDTEVTVVVGNPTSALLIMNITITYSSAIAPKAATLFLTELLIPVGIILAAPWIAETYKGKRAAKVATPETRK